MIQLLLVHGSDRNGETRVLVSPWKDGSELRPKESYLEKEFQRELELPRVYVRRGRADNSETAGRCWNVSWQ